MSLGVATASVRPNLEFQCPQWTAYLCSSCGHLKPEMMPTALGQCGARGAGNKRTIFGAPEVTLRSRKIVPDAYNTSEYTVAWINSVESSRNFKYTRTECVGSWVQSGNSEKKILMLLSAQSKKSSCNHAILNIVLRYTNSNWIGEEVEVPSITVKHTRNYTHPTNFQVQHSCLFTCRRLRSLSSNSKIIIELYS